MATAKTTDQLLEILSAGGGIIIDASKTTEQLVRLAAAAAHAGALMIVKNAGTKTTQQLVEIAASGKGRVIFDLT